MRRPWPSGAGSEPERGPGPLGASETCCELGRLCCGSDGNVLANVTVVVVVLQSCNFSGAAPFGMEPHSAEVVGKYLLGRRAAARWVWRATRLVSFLFISSTMDENDRGRAYFELVTDVKVIVYEMQ